MVLSGGWSLYQPLLTQRPPDFFRYLTLGSHTPPQRKSCHAGRGPQGVISGVVSSTSCRPLFKGPLIAGFTLTSVNIGPSSTGFKAAAVPLVLPRAAAASSARASG
jgi:hypothetical protein